MSEEIPVKRGRQLPTVQESLERTLSDSRIASPAQFLICLHIGLANIQEIESGGCGFEFSCREIAQKCRMDNDDVVEELRELIRRRVILDWTPPHMTRHGPINGLGIIDELNLSYDPQ